MWSLQQWSRGEGDAGVVLAADELGGLCKAAPGAAEVLDAIVDSGHPGIADLVRAVRSDPRPAERSQPIALVTGASRGIGRSLVVRLVAEGWRVAALARTAADLTTLAAEQPPGQVLPLVADVTDVVAMAEASAALTALWAVPDLVVANAGVFRAVGHSWEVDTDSWWADLQVNVLGVMNTLHVTVPGMLARGSGRFVAMSSGLGHKPSPWSSAYGASKAAVSHLIGSLGGELAGSGVFAFAVSPGMVRTEMTQWPADLLVHRPDLANLPGSAFADVELVGDLVVGIASGRLDRLSGQFLHARDDRDELLLPAPVDELPGG